MSDEFDFGFSTIDVDSSEENDKISRRLNRVRELITPLLANLAKDPHKDIHWPDRDKKIAEFKKKLDDIIDGIGED